jgi:flagellar basal body-associated protein FliL
MIDKLEEKRMKGKVFYIVIMIITVALMGCGGGYGWRGTN